LNRRESRRLPNRIVRRAKPKVGFGSFGIMAHQSPPASSNLTSENGTAAPESVDVAEAVALMADLGEAAEDEAEGIV
jgi:hypothetical protein